MKSMERGEKETKKETGREKGKEEGRRTETVDGQQ